jgi:caa(3)-type oxidase subunit IV
MADANDSHGHHGPKSQKTYLVIGLALAGFTIVSFIVNGAVTGGTLSADAGFWIILLVAIAKATFVVVWFMHLLWDWKKVGFMIVPSLILGAMFAVVLLPDTVLAWKRDRDRLEEIDAKPAAAAPAH